MSFISVSLTLSPEILFKELQTDLVQLEYLKVRFSKDTEDLVKVTFNGNNLKMRHIPCRTLVDDKIQ